MAAPRKLLPVRDATQENRLSQNNANSLIILKRNILGRFPEKFEYVNKPYPYPQSPLYAWDFDILINPKTQQGRHNGPHYFDWLSISKERPTVFYMRIAESRNDGHALLAIYFPKEDMFDIVSTYSIEPDTILAFYNFFSGVFLGRMPIVNDVACLADNPRRLRSDHCYNLQSHDTAEIGWCIAWMVGLSDLLSRKTNEEFWSQNWATRREVYRKEYDSFTKVRGFNSMETGLELWNMMLSKYYRGGQRKR